MPEEESALERARRGLYNPDAGRVDMHRSSLPNTRSEVPRGWTPPPTPPHLKAPHKKLPLAVRFLLIAIGFFVIAGGMATYFLLSGGRSISTDNVAITIDAPQNAAGGDVVPLIITVENHNPVAMTNPALSITFPNDTRSADDATQPLTSYDDSLGDIQPGAAVTRTVRAVLFGAESQSITIPIKVAYGTNDSNATFVKEKDYVITLTTSPVSISATSVSQISSGQSLTMNILVRSNASKALSDIAVKANYPFGFVPTNTSIQGDNGLFPIGTLPPGEERNLVITGTLTGDTTDTRVFTFTVGSTASSTNGALGITYASAESDIAITKPFLDVALSLNGTNGSTINVTPGEDIEGTLKWTNTLQTNVEDGTITVALSGNGYDPASVTTQDGFYQSSNGTITFSKDQSSGLADLAPGDSGTDSFHFTIKSASDLASLRSPTVGMTISIAGRRVSETGVPEQLSSTLTSALKISSGLSLSSRLVKTIGPYANTGPWPPQVGNPTTYTVLLTAGTGADAVGGAVTTMTLPSYVTFTGQADSGVTYTDSSRTVRWVAGDMNSNATQQTAFQISFLPSISQQGSSPVLVQDQTISGTDRFTQTTTQATAAALNTQTASDPAYQINDGSVQ